MDVTLPLAFVVPAGAYIIAVAVWLVRIEGRVNGHDKEHKQHSDRQEEMREDLQYIRERIDRALNGRN